MPFTSKLQAYIAPLLFSVLVACGSSNTSTNLALNENSEGTSAPQAGQAPHKIVGYFPSWAAAGGYTVKEMHTRGAAEKLSHLLFAFGGVENGRCVVKGEDATFKHHYLAEHSVDGVADAPDAALKGVLGQFRKLKTLHPDLKILWSIGGWSYSPGFIDAAKDVKTFANSCYDMVNDARWAGVFDGIDIDWEHPNACGIACDKSGPEGFYRLMSAVRARFGKDALVTAAIGAHKKVLTNSDFAKAEPFIDFLMPMTYDYAGAWAAKGPTFPHSPLYKVDGAPDRESSDDAIQYLLQQGIPAEKILLGIGFYGRGWKGVKQEAPLGAAEGPAPAIGEPGAEAYHQLKARCQNLSEVAGTAVSFCGDEWWSFDTPATVKGKMHYARQQGLGGAFFWQLSGDSANNELLNAMDEGLSEQLVSVDTQDWVSDGAFTQGIEGPAVGRDGVLFAVNAKKQGTIGQVTGPDQVQVFVELPNGSIGNGIRFDAAGNLLVADYIGHNILQIDRKTRAVSVLAHEARMNQPNDLAVAPNGIIYASDPNWGNNSGQLWQIDKGTVTLIETNMGTTNGIEVSPDGRTLYVNESAQRRVWAYDLSSEGTPSNKQLLIEFADHGLDGMRCDALGNLYIARYGAGVVAVVSPKGEVLKEITLKGQHPTNVAFGGENGKQLFVTLQRRGAIETVMVEHAGRAWSEKTQ